MATANRIAVWCECINILPIFHQISKKYFLVCCTILVINLCHEMEKVENRCLKTLFPLAFKQFFFFRHEANI